MSKVDIEQTNQLIAFSTEQQCAVIGHAIRYAAVWEQLEAIKITDKWISDPPLAEAFKLLTSFNKIFKRLPASIDEAVDWCEDEVQQGALRRTLTRCVELKARFPWDALSIKLQGWSQSRVIFESTNGLHELFNSGKHDKAGQLILDTAQKLIEINSISGLEPDGFVASNIRSHEEKEARIEDSKHLIPYAVPFLEDMLGGIGRTEIVLVGATSGAGKTEVTAIQSAHVASLGKRAHVFSLEAEPYEIERRIKYGYLSNLYRLNTQGIKSGAITYSNFRKNRLGKEFAPYEEEVERLFDEKYGTLHTYYKCRNDFGIKELKREILKLKGKTDFIALDHIHFVDIEGENENRELANVVKSLRMLSQAVEAPIFCIGHFNKEASRSGRLVPRKEAFQGTGALYQVATTCIMLARARGKDDLRESCVGSATYMEVAKSRLEGNCGKWCGVSFFDTYTNRYTQHYAVGEIAKDGKLWENSDKELPHWANKDRAVLGLGNLA